MPPPKKISGFARFDTTKLWQAIEAERARRGKDASLNSFFGYSLNRVARESGVSEGELHWLRAGKIGQPTVDTVARLLLWLGDANLRPYLIYDDATEGPAGS